MCWFDFAFTGVNRKRFPRPPDIRLFNCSVAIILELLSILIRCGWRRGRNDIVHRVWAFVVWDGFSCLAKSSRAWNSEWGADCPRCERFPTCIPSESLVFAIIRMLWTPAMGEIRFVRVIHHSWICSWGCWSFIAAVSLPYPSLPPPSTCFHPSIHTYVPSPFSLPSPNIVSYFDFGAGVPGIHAPYLCNMYRSSFGMSYFWLLSRHSCAFRAHSLKARTRRDTELSLPIASWCLFTRLPGLRAEVVDAELLFLFDGVVSLSGWNHIIYCWFNGILHVLLVVIGVHCLCL